MPTWLRQFLQMLSGRRAQAGRVQTRLTVLLLAIVLPLFIGLIVVLLSRADAVIQAKSDEQLATANRSVAANTTTWLDLNVAALNDLVMQPQIIGMDAAQQKPILEAMAAAYPQMYLVSTTDPQGINVARNDAGKLTDYSDRAWYKGAIGGAPLTLQTLIGRTTGRPALVASAPIQREPGVIVGVGMFASELTDVAQQVQLSTVGEAGFSYVINADNLVVAYPQPMPAGLGDIVSSVPITPLGDLSDYPPVEALRAGSRGRIEFTDKAGHKWQAYVDEMESGWGVVVQQPNDDFLSGLRGLQRIALAFIVGGVVLLVGVTALTVRQVLRPVGRLTETATAIAGGDLQRTAPAEGEDEFGMLGRAFNRMTGRLRDLIGSLEQRVADRTRELEQRAVQLMTVAEVGRAATSTLDPGKLAQQTVDLLRERFDLYYAGLFLVDEAGEYAVLEAGTSEPGRMMKEQGHKLLVGGESMVGAACAERKAHIALDTGAEPVRFANPLLPDTRSEMALPLVVGDRVLGALDVQSIRPAAFSDEDIAVMQLAADQVAVAVDNARKFSTEAALLEATSPLFGVSRRLAGVITTDQAAQAIIDSVAETEADGCAVARFGFSPDGEVETITFLGSWSRTGASRFPVGTPLPASASMLPVPMMGRLLVVPDVLEEAQMPAGMRQALARFGARAVVTCRCGPAGEVIGVVIVQRATPGPFSPVSLRLYETLVEQAAVVLERARLVEEAQRRAAQEQWLSQVSDQMQRAGDMGSLLQVAAEEVNRVLGGSRAYVQLGRQAQGIASERAARGTGTEAWQGGRGVKQEYPTGGQMTRGRFSGQVVVWLRSTAAVAVVVGGLIGRAEWMRWNANAGAVAHADRSRPGVEYLQLGYVHRSGGANRFRAKVWGQDPL